LGLGALKSAAGRKGGNDNASGGGDSGQNAPSKTW